MKRDSFAQEIIKTGALLCKKNSKSVVSILNIKPGSAELAKTVSETIKKNNIVVVHRYGTMRH